MKTVKDLKCGDKVLLYDVSPLFLAGEIESISPVGKRSLLQIKLTGKYQNSLLDARTNVKEDDKTLELLDNDIPLSIHSAIALQEEVKSK
jgi:hypothetical protein